MPTAEEQTILNGAVANLAQAANIASVNKTNRSDKWFAKEMYWEQRADALRDWNMQNDYNSPQSQMQRLRDAGLNPNLVYGKGADTIAGPIRSSTASTPQARPPQIDLGAMQANNQMQLMAGYDIKLKEAQTDNLKAQNNVALQEAINKAAQTAGILTGNEAAKFNLGQQMRLADLNRDKLAADIEASRITSGTKMQESTMAWDLHKGNLEKQLLDMANTRAQTAKTKQEQQNAITAGQILKKEDVIKALDAENAKRGMRPSDPFYWRQAAKILDDIINWVQKNPGKTNWLPMAE